MRYADLHAMVLVLKSTTLELQISGQLNCAIGCEALADTTALPERAIWLRSAAFARRRAAQLERQQRELV